MLSYLFHWRFFFFSVVQELFLDAARVTPGEEKHEWKHMGRRKVTCTPVKSNNLIIQSRHKHTTLETIKHVRVP